jgi:sugar/nucleoside kinase (ribokinase family)
MVMAPHPELEAIDWSSRPMLVREARRAVDGDLVSLQHAWAAVAETGTLFFPSDPVRPATLNLLPDTEIVLLRTSAIVGAYEEAWDRLRVGRRDPMTGGWMPRNLMLVTGPSRSADIEQTLELGAHGALVKGGHIGGHVIHDVLQTTTGEWIFESPRIETTSTHGTGCTLASAIAALLAQGRSVPEAVEQGRDYLYGAIKAARGLGKGHGPVHHGWLLDDRER